MLPRPRTNGPALESRLHDNAMIDQSRPFEFARPKTAYKATRANCAQFEVSVVRTAGS
jgi:hypothetical protein